MSDAFQPDQAGDDQVQTTALGYEDLVGDGKRYKTNDDVAKAVQTKDAYIRQLEREAAEAREALNKRLNEEAFLDKMERLTQVKSPSEAENPPVVRDEKPAVTEETIVELLEKREVEKARKANLDTVVTRLQDVYGPEWKARVQAQARQLGVGTEYLTDVASRSPAAFYNVMGINSETKVVPSFAPPRTQVNLNTASNTGRRDYEYFKAEKAKRGRDGEAWYFSQPVQQEIWKEVQAQGEDVFFRRSP